MSKNKINRLLPSEQWLKRNGFGELVKVMKKHPDKFAHIPQSKNRKEMKYED